MPTSEPTSEFHKSIVELARRAYAAAILAAQHRLTELANEARDDDDDEAFETLRYAADIVGQLEYGAVTERE